MKPACDEILILVISYSHVIHIYPLNVITLQLEWSHHYLAIVKLANSSRGNLLWSVEYHPAMADIAFAILWARPS